jgi:hypothetical protein
MSNKLFDDIEEHLLLAKKSIKKLKVPEMEDMNEAVNQVLDIFDEAKKNLEEKSNSTSKKASKKSQIDEIEPLKKPSKKSIKKPVMESGPKSKRTATSGQSAYRDFVKKHMQDSGIAHLPVTQRMGRIAELWRQSK